MRQQPRMTGKGGTADAGPDVDVAIVGCGPVGQLLAILLGQQGHRVVVVERWPAPYALPRAVVFDDEIARVLASAGVGDEAAAISEPADTYEWRNAAGETLLRIDWSGPGPSGWPVSNMFSQPELEAVLSRRLAGLSTVEVRRGTPVSGITDHGDHVAVEVGPGDHVTARWVVGCDGANSFVRDQMDTTVTDLGFVFDWLILDVILHEPREWRPVNLQICDPRRPTTLVSGGPGRRRWEFMRLPDETVAELVADHRAWELLAPWGVTPETATLERHAVYNFAARWADRWRDGRLLLAGDAAHLMPPFAGQGMCSGLRDAANLAWKLHLVLDGTAGDGLVDTYSPERSGHVQNAIEMSVFLGSIICVTDPEEVAQRDHGMTAAGGDPAKLMPPLPPLTLTGGVVHLLPDGTPEPGAGAIDFQANVAVDGRIGRFDELVGTGFVVAALDDLHGVLDAAQLTFLRSIGARLVQIEAPDATGGAGAVVAGSNGDDRPGVVRVVDLDSAYLDGFARGGYRARITRPDFYVFGTAATTGDLPALVDDLRRQLEAQPGELSKLPPVPSSLVERGQP